MTYTISRFCPCTEGEIIGDFKEEPEPVIDCKLCASEYYFKRVMRLDSWTDIYIEVWELKNR
jgi:hypothetical protein|tara:strand:+ start:776 stop:961 length:186 start_codon:yes stop_codon:yes gene_type:complete